jgi:drug/metabolite transporter (DMT)-like permease
MIISSVRAASHQYFENLSPPVKAGLWMLLAAAAFAGMSGVIREAAGELHPFQIAFFRNLFGLVWMVPWLVQHGRASLATGKRWFYILRSSLGLVGMLGSFYGVVHMGIAESIALSFTGPLFATIGAALILHEVVRLRRWSATIIGFIGVLVIVRPGPETFNPVALVVLLAAAASAGNMLVVKSLSRTEPPNAIVVYMVLYLTPISLIPALFVWAWPSPTVVGWMLLLGAFGTLGHLTMTRAMACAEASVVLPFDYLRLPFGAAIGYFAFAEEPDAWVFAGGGIIALSSIYIAHREAKLARAAGVASKTLVGDGAATAIGVAKKP